MISHEQMLIIFVQLMSIVMITWIVSVLNIFPGRYLERHDDQPYEACHRPDRTGGDRRGLVSRSGPDERLRLWQQRWRGRRPRQCRDRLRPISAGQLWL